MKADERTSGEVESTLRKMTEAYKTRRLKDLMDCFAPDADVLLYGTGADEKRIGPEQIRAQVERDWAQTESAAMSFMSFSTSAAGTVAWSSAEGAFKIRADGQDMTLPVRVSLVLEKRAGEWLIIHSHFSTPASGQEEGSSI